MSQSKEKMAAPGSSVIRFHWRQALKFPKLIAISFIVAPLTLILDRYVSVLLIASLLASIQAGTVTLESSLWLLAGYAGILFVSYVIGFRINLYAMWGLQVRGARNVYNEAFESLSRHALGFFDNTFTGSIVSQANKIGTSFINFWNMVIFQILFFVTSAVATIIGVAFIMWQYAVILAILVALFVVVSFVSSKFIRPRQKARSEAYTKISAQLADAVGNMMAVKTDSRESYERRRLSKAVDSMVTKEFYLRSGIMRISSIHSTIIVTMRVGALLASIVAIELGVGNAALIYLALTYTVNLVDELGRVNETLRTYYQIVGDSEEMLAIMDRPADLPDTSHNTLTITEGTIDFQNVDFDYKNETAIFKDLSLTVKGGERIGLVGPSGAGKTTLTKLLLRLVDPTDGRVLVDGQDLRQVSQYSLHKAISYVPQEPLLFHRSLKENIAYGRPSASDAEIKEAARQANALEFIEKLPEQFETLVGERGVKLSGGQRQRIAIARAILKDAPILVLDEATSALDSESEKLIQQALKRLMKGRTSIVIAHRLSTVASLDRIIVLQDGKIAEQGAHRELIAHDGLYAMLWKHQSGGVIED